MTNNLIEIKDENGVLAQEKFEVFLKNTNLRLDDIYLRRKGFNDWIWGIYLATIYFFDDGISVHVEKCNLNLVKRLFEDYTKVNPVHVKIQIERGDC